MVKKRTNINKVLVALLMISFVFIGLAALAVGNSALGPNDAPKAYSLPAVKDSTLLIKAVPSSVSPTVFTATLNPGQSASEIKTVGLSGSIPKADIVFSFDLTGSMGGVLSTAQTQAISIMTQLDTVISDANYGVTSHMDYPNSYTSFGYSNTYGTAGTDYAYALNQSITSNRTAVKNAINGLHIGYGNDGPEDYTRAFYESYADTRLGWRPGAKRILIHFGDIVPHDHNLFEGISGTTSSMCYNVYGVYDSINGTCTTGGDPGRDEIMQVTSDPSQIGVGNDDLDLLDVLDSMKANNVILLEVHNSGTYSTDQTTLWKNWVSRTGGGFYTISTGGTELANAIVNLTSASASNIGQLSLVTVPSSYTSWISSAPVSYTNLTIPSGGLSKTFTVTITPPADTPPGVYTFKVQAIADGGSVGEQIDTITVNGTPPGRIVQIKTNYTAAVGGTKAVPVELINGSDVAGAQTTITFDPSIVTVDSVSTGDFLTPTANIDNIAGTVKIAVARADAVGKSSATIAIVTFRGVAIGSSPLTIGGSSLNDASGAILAAPTELNGKITVGVSGDCGLNGDLNHNGILDTGDATLLLRKVVGLDP